MTGIIKKQLILPLLILFLGLFFTNYANAASLSLASDTVTTSRPSAAAPLAVNQAANDTQVTVTDLPLALYDSALWIASDSAFIFNDTGQSSSTVTVASMSAANTPASNQRNVYFTSTVGNTHHQGTAMVTPITATHTIKFNVNSAIPSGGKIVLTFPGAGANTASPSATGFSFNGMTTSNPTDVVCFPASACAGSRTVTGSNTITLVTNAAQNTGTTIFVNIGCTTTTNGTCTVFAPRLINPTKGPTAAGTADQWKITIQTTDTGGVVLDSAKVVVGTIESVQVQGTVEPYLTFTIAGVNNNTAACADTTNPGAGLDATATFVNLGSLSTAINISAQTLTISTNGSGGYALTATSSGRFINPATGVWFADANGGNGLTANDAVNGTAPVPGFFTAASTAFGIHPCFAAVGSNQPTIPVGWNTGATGGGAGAKYANPWNTGTNGFYAALASYNAPAANSTTTVEYAATAALTVPAGIYSTVFTYVATPIF